MFEPSYYGHAYGKLIYRLEYWSPLFIYDELSNQAQLCPEENFKWTLPA